MPGPKHLPEGPPWPDRAARPARVKASLGCRRYAADARRILRGHDRRLCVPLDQSCHADVLHEAANR